MRAWASEQDRMLACPAAEEPYMFRPGSVWLNEKLTLAFPLLSGPHIDARVMFAVLEPNCMKHCFLIRPTGTECRAIPRRQFGTGQSSQWGCMWRIWGSRRRGLTFSGPPRKSSSKALAPVVRQTAWSAQERSPARLICLHNNCLPSLIGLLLAIQTNMEEQTCTPP